MMNVLINHCWCSDCHWAEQRGEGEKIYDCRVIVSIRRIPEGKGYHDPVTEDWKNLIEEVRTENGRIVRLKSDVRVWLTDNIQDGNFDRTKYKEGWCIGTDEYNSHDVLAFNIFFQRQPDAMKFIKKFSVYKKPTHFLNYFKDIRKKLDFKTGKMVKDIR